MKLEQTGLRRTSLWIQVTDFAIILKQFYDRISSLACICEVWSDFKIVM